MVKNVKCVRLVRSVRPFGRLAGETDAVFTSSWCFPTVSATRATCHSAQSCRQRRQRRSDATDNVRKIFAMRQGNPCTSVAVRTSVAVTAQTRHLTLVEGASEHVACGGRLCSTHRHTEIGDARAACKRACAVAASEHNARGGGFAIQLSSRFPIVQFSTGRGEQTASR